jgi:hypothetical protein
MEVDPSSPAIGSSSRSALEETFTLVRDKQIKLQDDSEKKIFRELKDREFTHTPTLNPGVLQMIGTNSEFGLVFNNVGWKNTWELNEQGCRLLTIEFLCTLQPGDTEVSFKLFNKEFSPSWKNFSRFLGFLEQCAIDIDAAINGFDRTRFWQDISKEVVCHHPALMNCITPLCGFYISGWVSLFSPGKTFKYSG